ncbi:MAG: IPT/TIG domain-containing protein, partial [Bacteroidetes bacterium]|nr:IPT/TIG domain-containing protein [Bacteroidota bacterium]
VTVGGNTATSTSDFTVTTSLPTISSFNPSAGPEGTTVTITGTNFSAVAANNAVTFNGMAAVVTSSTTTSITTSVPSGATTGKIAVTVGGNTATSTTDFTVTTSLPTISSFNPSTGPEGTTVTITGTNFSAVAANNAVTFNGTAAVVTASTTTSITTSVPSGATTGKIAVTVGGNTATSTSDFTVIIKTTIEIVPQALTAVIEGKLLLDLEPIISVTNGSLDQVSLTIATPPQSGATAFITDKLLTVDYKGTSFSGTDVLTISACHTSGSCALQDFNIEVVGNIVVFNGISPGGANPKFIIQYIDVLPDTKTNSVYIFDRWENLVWHGTNYDNQSVVFSGSGDSGNALPSGVYFYKIDFASGRKTQTGFLSLRRQ